MEKRKLTLFWDVHHLLSCKSAHANDKKLTSRAVAISNAATGYDIK